MIVALPCPTCGPKTDLRIEDVSGWGDLLVACDRCYDVDCSGDPPSFHATVIQGMGRSWVDAVQEWNWQAEEASPVIGLENFPAVGQ